MNKKRIITLICIFAVSVRVYAGVGKTGAQFLKLNPSARDSAMAHATSGLADDVFAIYSNPAGLAKIEKAEIATTYRSYFGDTDYGFIGYASELRDAGVFGFSFTYLIVSDIDKYDNSETNLGKFNAEDISLGIGYGRKDVAPEFLDNLSMGASLKLISSRIDDTVARTVAVDIGAMYSPVENFNTTLVLQNIGPGIKFIEEADPLPLNLKLGIGYVPMEGLNIGGQVDQYLIDNKTYASLGGEYRPTAQLTLYACCGRCFYLFSRGSSVGLGAGLGFRIWQVGLDYAFVPFGDLGDTHQVTFSAKF